MDQQDNRPVPGASAQKGQPAPVWAGTPADRANAAQDHATHEPISQQPEQGWGAPVPGSPSAGWGTTPGEGQEPGAGAGWGAPQQYAPNASPRTGKGSWTAKKGLLVGGVAVVVAAAAGAGAYAAGNGATAASANNGLGAGANGQFGPGGQGGMNGQGGMAGRGGMTGQGGMAGPGSQTGTDGGMTGRDMDGGMGLDGGPGGLGMGGAGLNAAVHSEYVVLQGSSYVTMAGQTGTVTDISGTSMTVKSEDGFSRTYALDADVQVTQGMRQRGGSTGSTPGLSNVTAGATVRVTGLKNSDTYTAQTIQLAATGTAAPSSGTSSN